MAKQHKSPYVSVLALAKRHRLALFIGLCLGSLLYLGKYLSSLGAHGDHVAQVWGPSLSILGIISGTWLGVLQLRQQTHSHTPQDHEETTKKLAETDKRPVNALDVIIVAFVTVLAFCIPPLLNKFMFSHWQKDTVTSSLTIKHASSMKDGDTALITLPETKHDRLAITLTLDSLIDTGSCVAPARLTITPTHNGNDEAPLPAAQSGSEQVLNMRKNTPTQLLVHLDLSEEPTCRVKLNVADAVYYH